MIHARVSITDIVSDLYPGIKIKKSGSNAICCCPFHNEKTPSFYLYLSSDRWHCFGSCNEGGDVISFVMKANTASYAEAVKYLLKKFCNDVDISDISKPLTQEEEDAEKKRETCYIYNEYIQQFFVEQFWGNSAEAIAARDYAICKDVRLLDSQGNDVVHGRWPIEYVREIGIGYCPRNSSVLLDWASKKGLRFDILLELGIIAKADSGQYYAKYYGRLTIPQRSRYKRVETFTCRRMDGKNEIKYLNGCNSPIYKKSDTLFGLDRAMKTALISGKMYLVEGAPDAMRLQSLGINNACAALGGEWTESQLNILRPSIQSVCFIPDADEPSSKDPQEDGVSVPPGTRYVMRAGKLALKMGFDVAVRCIPDDARHGHQCDPDDYVVNMTRWSSMKEYDFISWYSSIVYDPTSTHSDQVSQMAKVCDLLVIMGEGTKQQAMLSALIDRHKQGQLWKTSLKDAVRRHQDSLRAEAMKGDDDLRGYGFYREHNHYYGLNSDGKKIEWSNFVLKPLYHVMDEVSSKRIFEAVNERGVKRIIEFKQTELTTLSPFKNKIANYGSYIFFGRQEQYDRLLLYLYDHCETTIEVKQLGWQNDGECGFYAFANGIIYRGDWHAVDDYGIVRLKDENFYLPAFSSMYRNSRELFRNERRFVHDPQVEFPMKDYMSLIAEVFGDNGKIGLCFYLATLFRDIIKAKTRFFPLLDIYGKKGTGKTELAVTLSSFFYTDTEATNIESTTIPALADKVAAYSNAIVHLDEYKNSIHLTKIDFLKGIWDSAGRTRMNMERDKKRESTSVDCGVVLTGQEIPTVDIALFTRLIYLESQKSEHTQEQKQRFNDLMAMRKMGASHITVSILKYRENFEAAWSDAWKEASKKVGEAVKYDGAMDRIINNWVILYASVLCLDHHIELPFTSQEIFNLVVNGIRYQNSMTSTTDELAIFWSMFSKARSCGEVIEKQDYKIVHLDTLRINGMDSALTFSPPKTILMLRKDICLSKAAIQAKKEGQEMIPEASLFGYLSTSPEYIGVTKSALKYKVFDKAGNVVKRPKLNSMGIADGFEEAYDQQRSLAFDYERLANKYDINIVREYGTTKDDEDHQSDIREAVKELNKHPDDPL